MFDNLIILYRTLISYVNRPEFPLFIYFWCKIEIDCVALDEKEKCKKKKKRLQDFDNYNNQNNFDPIG